MKKFVKSLELLVLLVAVSASCAAQAGTKRTSNFMSPDGAFSAVVSSSGREKGSEEMESGVEIRDASGGVLGVHDFSSADGEHGFGVDKAQWTPDGQFFVFRMRNSGGHSPMYAPVMFWSRSANHFYELKNYTADQEFSVTTPDNVTLATWPNMESVTLSLHKLQKDQAAQLQ